LETIAANRSSGLGRTGRGLDFFGVMPGEGLEAKPEVSRPLSSNKEEESLFVCSRGANLLLLSSDSGALF
jgi:hypothetical protein